MNSAITLAGRALYTGPEAMEMLNLSRTVIYEQIRSGRLLTVTQGRRRLVPASSMTAYIDLLVTEAMARTNARTPYPRRGRALLGRIAAAVDGGRRCRIQPHGQAATAVGDRKDQDRGEAEVARFASRPK